MRLKTKFETFLKILSKILDQPFFFLFFFRLITFLFVKDVILTNMRGFYGKKKPCLTGLGPTLHAQVKKWYNKKT